MTYQVDAFDFDLENGIIGNRHKIIDFKGQPGRPDGMTIDEEGFLWIAHWDGGCISRWNPNNGERIDKIDIPAWNVTSCFFGGENLDTLYITSARINTRKDILDRYPNAGSLFSIKLGIKGLKVNYFKARNC